MFRLAERRRWPHSVTARPLARSVMISERDARGPEDHERLAGRHRHRRHLHRSGGPAAVERRSPFDQGADPAQRSGRQHPGRARRRRPRLRGSRRPHPRHHPGHQRHRRGPGRSGGAGGDAAASRTCSISAAADASISIASTCRRAAPRRCRRIAASAWPSASTTPARPCWRPTLPRSPTRWPASRRPAWKASPSRCSTPMPIPRMSARSARRWQRRCLSSRCRTR